MLPIKFYNHMLSQPVRAVWMLLKANKIPFEDVHVDVYADEQKKQSYLSKFPTGTMPAIDDNGFCLAESVAIMQYICAKYSDKVAPHWYPSDVSQRARVDEYMNWHHTNTRINAAAYCRAKLGSVVRKIPPDLELAKQYAIPLDKTLTLIEHHFLKTTRCVTGDDVTLADLLCISEIMHPFAGGFDVKEARPKLAAWIEYVQNRLGPTFDEAHKTLFQIAESGVIFPRH